MADRGENPVTDARHTFVGSVAGIVAACEWLDATCHSAGVYPDTRYAIQVCAEELLGNIVRHGGRPSAHIEVDVAFPQGRIVLTVEDDGPPFDVSAAVPHRVDRTLDVIEPGGLGIQLIHSFASHVSYQRTGPGNRVILTFDDPRKG